MSPPSKNRLKSKLTPNGCPPSNRRATGTAPAAGTGTGRTLTSRNRILFPGRRFFLAAGILSLLLTAGCYERREVVATVGRHEITRSELSALIQDYRKAFAAGTPREKIPTASLMNLFLAEKIEALLLQEEGRHRGLRPRGQDAAGQTSLLRETLSQLGREVEYPSFQDARDYYRRHQEDFQVPKRYQVRHLLLASEHQAWEIREKVLKGELTLDAAARRFSLGAAASRGGQLPPMTLHDFLPEISRVLSRLEVGHLSRVIPSPYGYHLLRLEKQLPAGTLPFSRVENQIKDELYCRALRRHFQKWLTAAKKRYKITYNLSPAGGREANRQN